MNKEKERHRNNTLHFREICILWMEDSRKNWKPSSYVRYQECLNKYILPQWGERSLQELTQRDYDELINELKSRLHSSSINTVNTMLKGIIRYALTNRHLDNFPFYLSYSPSKKETDIDILTAGEMEALTEYSRTHITPTTLGVLLALYEGIRPGELCAMQWEDVDMDKGILYIRKTIQRIQNPLPNSDGPKTVLHLGMPKNGKERAIPIHPKISERLRSSWGQYPKEYYIIRDRQPMEPRSLSRNFKQILKQAEIRDVSFHALRHTFATCCVEAGMDIKALSEILGHTSVKATMDLYVHLSMEDKQRQMENL